MAKKLQKAQYGKTMSKPNTKSKTFPSWKEIQDAWNAAEKKATNPKNRKSLEQIQKEWIDTEKRVTNPKNKSANKIELFKKGGSSKKK